jgi:hypothetical protein
VAPCGGERYESFARSMGLGCCHDLALVGPILLLQILGACAIQNGIRPAYAGLSQAIGSEGESYSRV